MAQRQDEHISVHILSINSYTVAKVKNVTKFIEKMIYECCTQYIFYVSVMVFAVTFPRLYIQ
jgi:hypothetical protein